MIKKIFKIICAVVVTTSLVASTVVFATYVGGGEWHYGVGWTGTYGYSNYHHPSLGLILQQ